jgi:tetratricopeptide (TPR) repeat protein
LKPTFPHSIPSALFLAFCCLRVLGCSSSEFSAAERAIEARDFASAERNLVFVIQKDSTNEDAWYLLCRVRFEMKKYREMLDAFKRAPVFSYQHKWMVSNYRLSAWAEAFNEGVAAYNNGRDSAQFLEKAIEHFETAIAMEPDSSSTYYAVGVAHYAKNDLKNAQSNLEIALLKKPDFGEAARLLGGIYIATADEKTSSKDTVGTLAVYRNAIRKLEIACQSGSGTPEDTTNLLLAYDKVGDWEKALLVSRKAVENDPTNKLYRYAYGTYLLRGEKFEQSIEQFKKAIQIDPGYADAIFNSGAAYLNWGIMLQEKANPAYREKFAAALPYLEKSAEYRPDDALLWQTLGQLYANLMKPDKSKAAFERYDGILKAEDAKAGPIVISPESGHGTIEGTVKTSSGGTPLGEVLINLRRLKRFVTKSESDGSFGFTDVPAGRHDLEATVAGKPQVFFTKVAVSKNSTTKLNIEWDKTSVIEAIRTEASRRGSGARGFEVIEPEPERIATGRYFALLIGVNAYAVDSSIFSLTFPIADAESLASVLTRTYTFDVCNVLVLHNPDRGSILDKLDSLAVEVTPDDNLLIFFAGHGFFDKDADMGYWWPSTASHKHTKGWLSNSDVRDHMRRIHAKHILVISDACFSGSILTTRDGVQFGQATRAIKEWYGSKSRTALTSGAMQKVPDKSAFLMYLVRKLETNTEQFLTCQKLYGQMRDLVVENSPTQQRPQYAPVRECEDEGGDFVFIRK